MRISNLLLACALALSATAAYYSIVGLATIFSSAFLPVVIMASILEVSKLVVASWLYHRWNTVPTAIRAYLTSAVVILMFITSLGIFGFLSKAHVEQGLQNRDVTLRIEQIDSQITGINEIVTRYRSQLEQLDRSINIQLDANRAQQALAARQKQQAERDQIRQRVDSEQSKIQELQQQRTVLLRQMSVLDSEVGPIRYVAEFFVNKDRIDLEQAVRWMIIILVLVFDPLAVLMLIAANMGFTREEQRNGSVPGPSPAVVIREEPKERSDTPEPSMMQPVLVPIGHMIMKDGTIKVWDGSEYVEIDGGMIAAETKDSDTPKTPEVQIPDIAAIVESTMDQWLTKSVGAVWKVDVDEMRKIVKESMDDWLTSSDHAEHAVSDGNPKDAPDDTNHPVQEPSVEKPTDQEVSTAIDPIRSDQVNDRKSWL
jgi:hypothetical protein